MKSLVIQTINGPVDIHRFVTIGDFALHLTYWGRANNKSDWTDGSGRAFVTVTHIKSGLCAMHFRTILQAAGAARMMNGLPFDWEENNPKRASGVLYRCCGINVTQELKNRGGTYYPEDLPQLEPGLYDHREDEDDPILC